MRRRAWERARGPSAGPRVREPLGLRSQVRESREYRVGGGLYACVGWARRHGGVTGPERPELEPHSRLQRSEWSLPRGMSSLLRELSGFTTSEFDGGRFRGEKDPPPARSSRQRRRLSVSHGPCVILMGYLRHSF